MNHIIALPPRHARISTKLRHALSFMARKGLSRVDAARAAGISRQGLNKALSRQAVRDLLKAERLRFIAYAGGLRQWAKARAIEVALDLLQNSKNESIRAKMCEFLLSDAKVSPGCNPR